MWPSTSASRVYGDITCPLGQSCGMPNCIFSHKEIKNGTQALEIIYGHTLADEQPPAKRFKPDPEKTEQTSQVQETSKETIVPPIFTGLIAQTPGPAPSRQDSTASTAPDFIPLSDKNVEALPKSATKPISLPPKKAKTVATKQTEAEEPFLPRKIFKDPVAYKRRVVLLTALRDYMKPLNDKVAKAVKPETKALHLSAGQLSKLALDEEEKIVKENGPVYENVLKQRLATLMKMPIEEWVKARREANAKEKGQHSKKPAPLKVTTGMSLKEEVVFLSTLLASTENLMAHGFVLRPPTASALEETVQAQVAADYWEVCDRCNSRFQVFPDRREQDGALTSGGKCQYHWGKKVYPKKIKNQPSNPPTFSCCNEPMGSPGCTVHDTHVYKLEDVKRLSLSMPFIETPKNDKVDPGTAVCFDCEMGYTTHGLELLRITVVAWPSHKPLVDVLVRPLGHLLDLNTRFSGVTSEQFLNAKPYDPAKPKPNRNDLRIVDSPFDARNLFLTHVSPATPVLGHALENDLNVIRLIHPTIVDTVILFPTRSGLPYRHGLKTLARMHLGLDIQQAGAAGHDSYEDARTTGELIRFKVAKEWKKLKNDGWTITDDGVYPPIVPTQKPSAAVPPVSSMTGVPQVADMGGNNETKLKRKLDEVESEEAGEDQPTGKAQE